MVVLCACWGVQQVELKATAADVAPVFQLSLRSGIAAALVGAVIALRREGRLFTGGAWRPGLAVGCFFALEYLLLAEGLRYTSAAHAVVFLYTSPIFAALGLHWRLTAERLSPLQWAGVALAFGGIALAFLGRPGAAAASDILYGDFLCLLAGASWGTTTVVLRTSSLSEMPAKLSLFYQLAGAFVILFAAAAVTGQTAIRPTPLLLAGLAFQSVVVAFASFLVWFWMLRRYLASRLGVLAFMTPLFGVLFGAALLDEAIEPGFLSGFLLVFAGILLVSGDRWLRQAAGNLLRGRAAN